MMNEDTWPVEVRDIYWKIVNDTLIEIFNCKDAKVKIDALRLKVDAGSGFYYHNEPYDSACHIMNMHDKDMASDLEKYIEIRDRYW